MSILLQTFYRNQLPPHNYIAEEILLGMILTYPDLFTDLVLLINSESFFLEYHQIIYNNFLYLYKTKQLNTIELIYNLGNTDYLYRIGGFNKILDLMKQSQIFMPSSNKYLNTYAKELIHLINFNYIKRIMIQYAYHIIKLAYNTKSSHHTVYNKASQYLNIAENKIPRNNLKNFQELISDFLINIKNYNNKTKDKNNINTIYKNKIIIKSGFTELDKLIGTFSPGDLIIIAGRPSIGKTSFAINIAYNILTTLKQSICIFSLEMSNKQIIHKLIGISSNINCQNLLNKRLNNHEWNKIKNACYNFLKLNMYIDDHPNMSIDYIEYTSKFLIKENKIVNVIIIDYLQLIQTQIVNNNRNQEISYITRKIKLLAQYLNLPILTLSQLNRSIEYRSNKKPILSDLKESGCINFLYNIHLNIECKNQVHITRSQNLTSIFTSINSIINIYDCLSQIKFNHIKLQKLKQKLYTFIQHTFILTINKKKHISLTYNHKYLNHQKWAKLNWALDNHIILTTKQIRYNNQYLKQIKYLSFTKTYDINTLNYFNFICKQIILHNSIEQDADIVIILYKQAENYINQKSLKLIDLSLCKNRNGPIGECQLLFRPNTNKFNNITETNLTNHNYIKKNDKNYNNLQELQ